MKTIKLKKTNTKNGTKKNKKLKKDELCNEERSIFIVDYANIIYTLFEKYHSFKRVALHFYLFILKELKKGSFLFIVSKLVVIKEGEYDIKKVFEYGEKESKQKISLQYFQNNQLNIYNLEYPIKTSSSVDDIMFWYISTRIWFTICKKPRKNMFLLTNDKQRFNKNLFGKTEEERSNHINVARDLKITTIDPRNNYKYKTMTNLKKMPELFYKWIDTVAEDNKDLECDIVGLVELLMGKEKIYGYVKNNPNFEKKNFKRSSFKVIKNFKELGDIKKSKTAKNIKCKRRNSAQLKYNKYFYALIKYMQLYMYDEKNGKKYGDFYGSLDKADIIRLFE